MSDQLSIVAKSVKYILASRSHRQNLEPNHTSPTQASPRPSHPVTAPNPKATPAQRLLRAMADWNGSKDSDTIAVSARARVMLAHGYKTFFLRYPNGGYTSLALRACESDAVELHTVISYPDRRGNGTATLDRLCRVADDLKVGIWLDAYPFGRDRDHIPLPKLIDLYRRFGFFRIREVNPAWLCGCHRSDGCGRRNTMLRNPNPAE